MGGEGGKKRTKSVTKKKRQRKKNTQTERGREKGRGRVREGQIVSQKEKEAGRNEGA